MARAATSPAIGAAAAPAPAAAPLLTPGFVGLLLAWFALGLTSAPTQPLLPVYVDGVLHQPPIFTSTLRSLQLGSGAVGALVGGSIADAAGRKLALIIGALSGPLAAALFLTHAAWLMILLSLMLGILSSIQTIGGQTYLMGAVRQVRLGFAAALFFIGSTLGTSLGNFIAAPALDHWGVAVGFNIIAVAMIVSSLVVIGITAWLLPPPPRQAAAVHVGAFATLRGYAAIIGRPDVRLLVGLRLLPTCYWGAATLLVPLLLYRASQHAATAAFYSGVSLALAATCQLMTGRIADHVGRRRPAVVATALIVIAAAGAGIFAESVPGLYVFGVLGACSAWSLSVLMPGLIKDLSAPGEEGRTLALTHFTWSMAMLIGSLVGGALVVFGGLAPFALAAAINIPAVAMAVALLRREGRGAPAPAGPLS